MSVLGWILAGLLGAAFIGAGASKLASSRAKLLTNPNMAWAGDFSDPQIKAISTLEVLGGLGVILPWLFNIAPVLTPIAAIGCGLVMVGAARVHLLRHEPKGLPPTIVLLLLAVVVAVIRFSQL